MALGSKFRNLHNAVGIRQKREISFQTSSCREMIFRHGKFDKPPMVWGNPPGPCSSNEDVKQNSKEYPIN